MGKEYLNAFMNSSATIRDTLKEAIQDAPHKAVAYDAETGQLIVPKAKGDPAVGLILSDAPGGQGGETPAGAEVDVLVKDIGLGVASEAIKAGEPVTADVGGTLARATGGNFVFGFALTAAGAAGDAFQVQITKGGTLSNPLMGPGGAMAPAASETLEGLNKNPGDLIENERLEYDGDTVKVYGDLKNINTAWTEFNGTGKNTGHFVPVLLPAACVGQEVTIRGRRDGDRKVKIDDDRTLVTRLENLSGTAMDIEMGGKRLCTFDFSALVPVGEAAFSAGKTDFGEFGKREDMVEDFAIAWDGVRATVTGKLKKHKATSEKLNTEGYHFPVGMSDWYFDGVPKRAGINDVKEITDKEIVLVVHDLAKPARFEYNGMTVMEFDLSGMTLEE